MMKRIFSCELTTALIVALLVCGIPANASENEAVDPEAILNDAVSRAGDPRAQALALVRLAWPDEPGTPGLAEAARTRLIGYGQDALPALREGIQLVKPEHQADLVTVMIEARQLVLSGIPTGWKTGLTDIMWFGTREARLRALPELARARVGQAVLPIIDAAIEDPELLPSAIVALGKIGDRRARFFLEEVMLEGDPALRPDAAVALANIGGKAIFPLKAALRSDERSTRLNAVRALLPIATIHDLSALYSYVYAHPDDDPDTIQAVKSAVTALEKLAAGVEEQDPSLPPPE
jgi:hypothetical protein